MPIDSSRGIASKRSNGQRSLGFLASSTRTRLLLDGYTNAITRGARILDLGCGNGAIAKTVANAFEASVVGVDVENFLEYDFPFRLIADHKLPFDDESFDVVMINDMLHHTASDRQEDSIREAIRVGRKVLIFETEPTMLAKCLDVVMNWVVYGGREATPLSHRTPREWGILIEGLGATCLVRRLNVPLYYPLRHFTLVIEKGAVLGSVTETSPRVPERGACAPKILFTSAESECIVLPGRLGHEGELQW